MIEINNLTSNEVDEEFLKRVAKRVLKGENREEMDLSIVLMGEARMREINREYRGKNKATDVLSFGDDLNEIVICLSKVKKNAKKYQIKFGEELARVLTHGIKNICQNHT